MNPPSSPRPKAMPSFRSYISVELPFTLSPTAFCTTRSGLDAGAAPCAIPLESKREVEAFLPPSFVVECVQHAVPQRNCVRPDDTFARRADGGPDGARSQHEGFDGTDFHEDASDDESRSVSSNNNSSGGSDDDAAADAAANREGTAKESGEQKPEVRLLTRHRRDYCTDPIFSGWRSTNWSAESDPSSTTQEKEDRTSKFSIEQQADVASTTAGTQDPKRRRLEVFSSIEPQVLLNGYYRNDALVQVRRTRRIRRYRDPETNAVLREDFIERGADCEKDMGKRTSVGAAPSSTAINSSDPSSTDSLEPALATAVLGVVSRELELARPADFTFALFTPEQLRASPSLCGADFFPPAHYLTAKAPFEVHYEPGKDANTSVPIDSCADAARSSCVARGDFEGSKLEASTHSELQAGRTSHGAPLPPSASSQFEFGALPMMSIGPEENAVLPTRLPAHDDFLRNLPSSLDGSRDDDPPEVRMIVRLLAERPAWIVHDLTDAMLQSGVCPRTHRNKQVMNCFTYVIRSGPFNRLRLRLGYDPYANSSSAPYERIAVRLHRRSDVGVRLRDVSRSPFIESVLRLLLKRDRVRRAAYKAEPGHERRSTLLELQCRAIRDGLLVLPYQPIDAMDDAVIAEIIRNVVVVDEPMERNQRGQRRGWLSEAAYMRAMTHFTDSLTLLLEQEVEPLLRKFKGEDEATHAKNRGHYQDTPSVTQRTASLDDDDDIHSSLSAMSSATAGDLSSDAEDD
ncbi:hypothetical protein ABL78_7061 [Leptomonas seymouri]|uniref:Transcription factor IIIC subunit 5 HTH domain-containing protein n=1 Tax=Leptomonas seymouri TaxID=5684 RepID=A0A0N1I2I9_LEPSE|nr:hypothetical protein ABL78_7061 [Leptomonas seymouri]|eukprot:KPI83901.1 hypothetical protein ABL78_7061 [Leptomonas seymouri]